MTTRHDVRRRIDGSIDVEFYRRLGEAERHRAMSRLVRRASALVASAYAFVARNTGNDVNVMAITSKASHIPHPDATVQLGSILSR